MIARLEKVITWSSMSTFAGLTAFSYLRERRLLTFAVAALVIGAALRVSFPADIEYKSDERWMFEMTQAVAQGEAWPATGMTSSQRVVNPGLSVWVFIGLQKVSGADTPVGLARGVQVLCILAIIVLFLFAFTAIPEDERRGWVWGAALICVSPLSVVWDRKIWAQSVLPLFAMLFLIGWWYRHRHWSAAFLWGFIGALLGQIHMPALFLPAAVVAWTVLFDAQRKEIYWFSWVAGSVVGALGLVPWLIKVSTSWGTSRYAFEISAWYHFKWWNYWVSNFTGLVSQSALGGDFAPFLRYPLIGSRPTYLVLVLHVILVACALYLLTLVARRLWTTREDWSRLFVGKSSDSSLVIGSYLWGCGLLLTAMGVPMQRHYLAMAFPLVSIWLTRFLDRDERWGARAFAVLWTAQLLVSALFMYYIHVNGGAANGDYGVAYSAQ
jgi:hypothetical protein